MTTVAPQRACYEAAVDKVSATLRTFGVLLGLWVILAVIGIATGVVPIGERASVDAPPETDGGVDGGGVAEPEMEDGGAEADGGPRGRSDAGSPTADGASDTTDPDPAAAPEDGAEPPASDLTAAPAVDHGARWSVCAASSEPSLAVADVFGDARPEILVGCADGWHVLGLGAAGPTRVAVFSVTEAPAGQHTVAGPAGLGDVDGDGATDLVLPLARLADTGASRGGGLYWIPRDGFGGIREPVTLAPITAVAVALGGLDANAGAEIVAMNRANALAQLPSEAWVFAGGAAPTRAAALVTGLNGSAVGITDIDRDGHTDVIALGDGRVDLHFGDGAGAFERSHTLSLEGAREIGLGDLDGDGGADLVVLGNGLRWIRAGALEGMEPHGVDGVPANLRGLQVVDADGDGAVDLLGWDHPRLVFLRQRGAVDFEPRTAFTLAGGSFGPRRHRVVDLDSDGAIDDLVLLGTSAAPDAPVELLLLNDALEGSEFTPTADARAVPDAPLVLRATLR